MWRDWWRLFELNLSAFLEFLISCLFIYLYNYFSFIRLKIYLRIKTELLSLVREIINGAQSSNEMFIINLFLSKVEITNATTDYHSLIISFWSNRIFLLWRIGWKKEKNLSLWCRKAINLIGICFSRGSMTEINKTRFLSILPDFSHWQYILITIHTTKKNKYILTIDFIK